MSAGNGVKPRKKPVQKPVARIISPNGGAKLTPGNPGNRGGAKGKSGRLPHEYVELCRDLVTSSKALAGVEAILNNSNHPHFVAMYRHLSERGYGKPAQPLTGEGGQGPVRIVYDEMDDDGNSD